MEDVPDEVKKQYGPYWMYFDYKGEYHPTEEMIRSIEVGTPISEVVEKIGKPHYPGITSGVTTVIYEADTGRTIWCYLFLDQETVQQHQDEGLDINELFLKYGTVCFSTGFHDT